MTIIIKISVILFILGHSQILEKLMVIFATHQIMNSHIKQILLHAYSVTKDHNFPS